MALSFFSSGRIWLKATREWSSMQTWRYSHPMPRALLWPVRSPVTRCPGRSKRPSFLMSNVDEFARVLALVAPDRLGRFERLEAVEAEAPEDAADGCGGDAELGGDLRAGPAPPAQRGDPADHRGRGRSAQGVRSRRAVPQAFGSLGAGSAGPTCARCVRRPRRPWPRPSGSAPGRSRGGRSRLDRAA